MCGGNAFGNRRWFVKGRVTGEKTEKGKKKSVKQGGEKDGTVKSTLGYW